MCVSLVNEGTLQVSGEKKKTHWNSQILNFVLHSWHGNICFQNITVLKRLHEQATYLAKIKAKTS
jgi:hypothetical protein